MMPIIARQSAPAYGTAMPRKFMRFVALLALLFMPVVMTSTPAAVHSAPAAEAGNCADHQKPAEEPAQPQVHCTACSALPAVEAPAPAAALPPQTPRLIAGVHRVSGIEPETATPPPKSA